MTTEEIDAAVFRVVRNNQTSPKKTIIRLVKRELDPEHHGEIASSLRRLAKNAQ